MGVCDMALTVKDIFGFRGRGGFTVHVGGFCFSLTDTD